MKTDKFESGSGNRAAEAGSNYLEKVPMVSAVPRT